MQTPKKYPEFTLRKASNIIQFSNENFIHLSCTPINEKCIQVGDGANLNQMVIECNALINQLIRMHGEPPEGCKYFVLEQVHDFGIYYEAALLYNEDKEGAVDYMYLCEYLPGNWDRAAIEELRNAGYYISKGKPAQAEVLSIETVTKRRQAK